MMERGDPRSIIESRIASSIQRGSTDDSPLRDSPLTDWCSFSASRCQSGRIASFISQLRA